MRLQLRVEVSEAERIIMVNLAGPDRAMLLSNSASLLNSLEYLVNKTFRTGKDERIASILLDSENYRQHREAELRLLAMMASQKVISQRRPLVLQPMTPRERRIVHLALASIEGVRTESNGTGDQRSVTIYPKT
jgi:spoIIIJ-associated protein